MPCEIPPDLNRPPDAGAISERTCPTTAAARLRPSTLRDVAQVGRVLTRAYGRLLVADYPAEVLAAALPLITRAQPTLVGRAGYHVVEAGGRIVACGGWTPGAPGNNGRAAPGVGHVRHLACDPDHLRRGHAGRLMGRVMEEAQAAGVGLLCCLSTRTAVGFYRGLGFVGEAEVEVRLAPGVFLPSVEMRLNL